MGRERCLRIKDIEKVQNFFHSPEKKHLCWGCHKRRGLSLLNLSAGFKSRRAILPAFVSEKFAHRQLAVGRRLVAF